MTAAVLVSGALAGCAAWPDLDDPGAQDAMAAPAPRLGPMPALLASVDDDAATLTTETEVLQARADALRIRAARVAAQD